MGQRADKIRQGPQRDVQALDDAGLTGFVRPFQLERAGLTRDQLPALVRAGVLERVGRGLFRRVGAPVTEQHSLAMACARVPDGVVALLSALRVHDIGTQAPASVWLAIPHKARAPRVRDVPLRLVRFSGAAATLGVEPIVIEGVATHLTNPARTVLDCFRFERIVSREAAMEAFEDGLRRGLFHLGELARMLEVLPSRRLAVLVELWSR
jgi:predicted transcriptional regulator of viral defense system